MIKKLRRKLVLMVMAVVTMILLAIFLTMLYSTQKNSERMSNNMLQQALAVRTFPAGGQPGAGGRLPPAEANAPNMRLPVLVLEVDAAGRISVVSNQLHFIREEDIEPILNQALGRGKTAGTLSAYGLRFWKNEAESGTQIAFADVSMEQEVLKALIVNALLVGGAAMLLFFLLSMVLAHWAVKPIETAWERQKQFVANASHELKTPLTVILSNADMLQKNGYAQDEKNALRLEHVHAEAKRMKRLVDDMLTLAKSDSSFVCNPDTVVDFSYIVKSAVLVYEPLIYDENKAFSYEIEEGLCVMGDAARLQEVARILLDNARKYSPGGGSIHVCMERGEAHSLRLSVRNSGMPIPAGELDKIFLRFYRLDESRSAHESFGLGLSIAQSIVSEHKGDIRAESDAQTGNRFVVTLPIA